MSAIVLTLLSGASCVVPQDTRAATTSNGTDEPVDMDPHRTASEDEREIRELLSRHYLRGMDELSFEVFAPAFHPSARLAFVTGGELALLDLTEWRARLDSIRADESHPLLHERSKKHVDDIDVAGDVARATVRFVFPSRTYTDFLQLVRGGGEWRIIAKTFHLELST